MQASRVKIGRTLGNNFAGKSKTTFDEILIGEERCEATPRKQTGEKESQNVVQCLTTRPKASQTLRVAATSTSFSTLRFQASRVKIGRTLQFPKRLDVYEFASEELQKKLQVASSAEGTRSGEDSKHRILRCPTVHAFEQPKTLLNSLGTP